MEVCCRRNGTYKGASFPEGLKAEYFDNTKLQGTPKVRKEEWINFEPANQAPDPFLPKSPLSVRWTGKLRPTVTGQYTLVSHRMTVVA